MNELLELFKVLLRLEKPDRQIDQQIALLVGYTKSDPATPGGKPSWLDPSGGRASNAPYFTADTDHAALLAKLVAPNERCALSWDEDAGYAKLGDLEVVTCKTAAIALTTSCVAFLIKQQK